LCGEKDLATLYSMRYIHMLTEGIASLIGPSFTAMLACSITALVYAVVVTDMGYCWPRTISLDNTELLSLG